VVIFLLKNGYQEKKNYVKNMNISTIDVFIFHSKNNNFIMLIQILNYIKQTLIFMISFKNYLKNL